MVLFVSLRPFILLVSLLFFPTSNDEKLRDVSLLCFRQVKACDGGWRAHSGIERQAVSSGGSPMVIIADTAPVESGVGWRVASVACIAIEGWRAKVERVRSVRSVMGLKLQSETVVVVDEEIASFAAMGKAVDWQGADVAVGLSWISSLNW
nr:hypothetical protein Iba_chr10bCG11110 [Ipomoea batatas]GMD48683.1 hypothetical protein Iba_chr10fCG8730 [Ipomoea batatas]